MKKSIFLTIFFIILGLAFTVYAKKGDSETMDLEQLNTTVENHGVSLNTLTNQVNEVVNQFQTMNGDVGRNYKKNREQDKILKDAQTRLQVLEDQINSLTSQLQELQKEGLLTNKSSQQFDDYKKYARGLEYINSSDFDKAIKEFELFQKENPKSIYNSYAQYWIGESYFRQADYPMAIKQYQKLLAKNPQSAKAPTALYRQGLSFYQLNSYDDAVAFFTKVIRTYPKSIEAIQASGQIKRINNIIAYKKQQELEMKMVQ